MRKFAIVILALFINSIGLSAQSVLGIRFGSNRDDVMKALVTRFGESKIYGTHENGELRIYDFSIGNFFFDSGTFDFQYNGALNYFYNAKFQRYFKPDNIEAAKSERDYLYSLIADKYSDDYLDEYINEQGFKCYQFGTNPRDDSMPLGYISLSKSYGKDGIRRLYLILEYGPIYYFDKSSDF